MKYHVYALTPFTTSLTFRPHFDLLVLITCPRLLLSPRLFCLHSEPRRMSTPDIPAAAAAPSVAPPHPTASFPPKVCAFLAKLDPGLGSKETFKPRGPVPDMWFTAIEEKIFATVRAVCVHYGIAHVAPRVAGGWVRDKILGKLSDDVDIALENMQGEVFAGLVNAYLAQHDPALLEAATITGTTTPPVGTPAAAAAKSANFSASASASASPSPSAPLPQGSSAGTSSSSRVAVIKSNPAKSKHLSTATFKLHGQAVDASNLRTEVYHNDSRIPLVQMGSPRDDVMRRDFTLNSLFYNILDDRIEDVCGDGVDDLRRGVLRAPLPAFKTFFDDPLRVLRCARFSARFRFRVTVEIEYAAAHMTVHKSILRKISRERVGMEVRKMLTEFGTVPIAFAYLCRWGLRPVIFAPPAPELLTSAAALALIAPRQGGGGGKKSKAVAVAGQAMTDGADDGDVDVALPYCAVSVDPDLAAQYPLFASPEVVHRLVLAAHAPAALEQLAQQAKAQATALALNNLLTGATGPAAHAPAVAVNSNHVNADAAAVAPPLRPGTADTAGASFSAVGLGNISEDTVLTSLGWRCMDALHDLFLRRYPATFKASKHPTKEEAVALLSASSAEAVRAASAAKTAAAATAAAAAGAGVSEGEGDGDADEEGTGDGVTVSVVVADDSRTPAPDLSALSPNNNNSSNNAPVNAAVVRRWQVPGSVPVGAVAEVLLAAPGVLSPQQQLFVDHRAHAHGHSTEAGDAVARAVARRVGLWALAPGPELSSSISSGSEAATCSPASAAAVEARLLAQQQQNIALQERILHQEQQQQSGKSTSSPAASHIESPSQTAFAMALLAAFLLPCFGRRVHLGRGRHRSLAHHHVLESLKLSLADANAVDTILLTSTKLQGLAIEHNRLLQKLTPRLNANASASSFSASASACASANANDAAAVAAAVGSWTARLAAATAAAGEFLPVSLALAEVTLAVLSAPLPYTAPPRKYRAPTAAPAPTTAAAAANARPDAAVLAAGGALALTVTAPAANGSNSCIGDGEADNNGGDDCGRDKSESDDDDGDDGALSPVPLPVPSSTSLLSVTRAVSSISSSSSSSSVGLGGVLNAPSPAVSPAFSSVNATTATGRTPAASTATAATPAATAVNECAGTVPAVTVPVAVSVLSTLSPGFSLAAAAAAAASAGVTPGAEDEDDSSRSALQVVALPVVGFESRPAMDFDVDKAEDAADVTAPMADATVSTSTSTSTNSSASLGAPGVSRAAISGLRKRARAAAAACRRTAGLMATAGPLWARFPQPAGYASNAVCSGPPRAEKGEWCAGSVRALALHVYSAWGPLGTTATAHSPGYVHSQSQNNSNSSSASAVTPATSSASVPLISGTDLQAATKVRGPLTGALAEEVAMLRRLYPHASRRDALRLLRAVLVDGGQPLVPGTATALAAHIKQFGPVQFTDIQ